MARLLIAPIDARGAHPSAPQVSIERILHDEGIIIDHATDAADAARRFASAEHDLLILTHDDLAQAPRAVAQAVSGLRARAAQEGRRYVPVLVLTSAPEHTATSEAKNLGADDVLGLGTAPQLLCSRVRAYLALSSHKAQKAASGGRGPTGALRYELTQRLVHDLRNPLAGLTSNLAYVDDRLGTLADPEVLEALSDCRAAVGRLRRSATMLVDLARMEDGSLKPRRVETLLVPVLQDVFAQRMHEAHLRDLRLTAQVPPGLKASFDPELCGRLLHALLDHALRYAQSGTAVEVSAAPHERGLDLRLSAQGEWLPRAEFKTGEHSWPPSVVEVGLGLHYARLAAQCHGGAMEVAEEPGPPPRTTARIVL